MHRHFTSFSPVVVFCVAAAAVPVMAQNGPQSGATVRKAAAQVSGPARAELLGTVEDDLGEPLTGVVVSALGSTTAFAVSDSEGRFAFHDISYGPYLVRAHLEDHLRARAVLVQVNRASDTMSAVVLTRRAAGDQPSPVLAAGVGAAVTASGVAEAEEADHDHGEVAWRLRHLKRSVLKNVDAGLIASDDGGSFLGDTFSGLGRAVGSPARLAASLFSGVPMTGQVDFLTSTSFDQPQDLLSMQPRGVAFVSLEAPTGEGHWAMRAAVMQGDLSSWVLAGSYRHAPTAHRYEAGVSYGTQRYQGGSIEPLPLVADAGRSVGTIRLYDNWTISPRLSVSYGARYAYYDYVAQPSLISPRASVTLTPFEGESLKVLAAVSRRTTAPGAAEFVPPWAGPWLPPERTFSPIAAGHDFAIERVDHVELGAEREWGHIVAGVRAFRQTVDDQIVTLFGANFPGAAGGRPGHYFAGSAGDIDATGWSVSARRATEAGTRASIEYTNVEARWIRRAPEAQVLALVAGAVPGDTERVHDLTASVEGVLPVTETRVFMVYKINSRFADRGAATAGARFDLRVNQSLPFLDFSGARWEMLVAVRSLFSEELADASIYDELLVVGSPKRMVGGVAVSF